MNLTDIEKLLKILKKHGVREYKNESLHLIIDPKVGQFDAVDKKSKKEITEDELFYSATALKPRK